MPIEIKIYLVTRSNTIGITYTIFVLKPRLRIV